MKVVAEMLYNEIREMDSRGGLYVWVDPDESSVLVIQRLLSGAPFKTEQTTEYHVTVMHHQGELPFAVKPPTDRPIAAQIVALDNWEDHKGRSIVVAILKSSGLYDLHHELAGQSLQHSHDDYTPHLTCAYNVIVNARTRLWLDTKNQELAASPVEVRFDTIKASSLG
jgi:2'-5' RNA ligase